MKLTKKEAIDRFDQGAKFDESGVAQPSISIHSKINARATNAQRKKLRQP